MIYETLDVDLALRLDDFKLIIPIVGGIIGFIIFWFTQKSPKIKQSYFDKYGEEMGSAKFIMFSRYLGGISMGAFPAILYLLVFPTTTLVDLGLGVNPDTLVAVIIWIIALSALIIPLVNFSAKKPKNLVNYPQIRTKEWNKKLYIGNLLSWAFYLLGYEFLFRGVLFFPVLEVVGLWGAIGINIALYAGTHIPKGLDETIGAIPLAVVLCILSVLTGSIWIAFFVHLAIAWTNTLSALKHNPDIHYIK